MCKCAYMCARTCVYGCTGHTCVYMCVCACAHCMYVGICVGFPRGSDSKESARNVGDPGVTPWSGRPSGEGNVYPCACASHTCVCFRVCSECAYMYACVYAIMGLWASLGIHACMFLCMCHCIYTCHVIHVCDMYVRLCCVSV